MIFIFASFIPLPNNEKQVLIGDNSGKLFIAELNDLAEIDIQSQSYQSILENSDEIYSFPPIGGFLDIINHSFVKKDKYPSIRNLIRLSDYEIIGHSDYGDIFICNCKNEEVNVEIIREGKFNSHNAMYQIASLDSENFITCGNYGVFWIYSRNSDGTWNEVKADINDHAHFALELYNEELEYYITNNFRGTTRILDKSCSEIFELFGFDNNLQNMVILPEMIAAVDYFGNSHLYSKSKDENRYINIQTIDCDNQTQTYPDIIYHEDFFYAAFPNALWKFDPELNIIQKISLNCKDIKAIGENIAVLTSDNILLINPNSFTTPEDYINYKYLKAGIVGYTDTGKSTFCYKMIYGEYKDDLGTTSGTLTWCLEFDDGDKVFIKDIPGQHDEMEFYFPKLKDSDIIFAMCKKKDSIKPWKETIDMCEKLRDNYNIKHFIFLRSKSDDIEKAPRKAIEAYLERKGFNKDMLFDVSAKNEKGGIEEIIDLLGKDIFWENKKISSENKIKTKLISAIGEARSVELDKITLNHFELPGFEDLSPSILEKFIKKVADEGNIYYIPRTKEIIFETEKMGKCESFILNLFSINEGLINEEFIINELKNRYSEIDDKELKYYYGEFINYLTIEEEICEILPKTFLVKSQLRDKLNIPEDLLCTEIKIENSIQIMDIITLFENPLVKLEEIAKNGFKFADKGDGIIYIELLELSDFDINVYCSLFRIYIKNSETIESFFEKLYEMLRSKKLVDLPKMLNFTKSSEDDLENLCFLFNFPDETPVIDFKRELNYEKGKKKVLKKIQKELLKDIIALGNSSYLFDDSAYLIIGIEEKNGEYKSIRDIKNQSGLFQQIAFLCRKYLRPCFNISHISINVYDLFELVNSGDIRKKIPFTSKQEEPECNEKIMVIHITREPKECLELDDTISWLSPKGIIKKISKGKGWIRIGSHTFDILNEERKKLYTF